LLGEPALQTLAETRGELVQAVIPVKLHDVARTVEHCGAVLAFFEVCFHGGARRSVNFAV
jgi:hypothetical protein